MRELGEAEGKSGLEEESRKTAHTGCLQDTSHLGCEYVNALQERPEGEVSTEFGTNVSEPALKKILFLVSVLKYGPVKNIFSHL